MSRLLWRIAVVLALALILGPAFGFVTVAMWDTHREQVAMLILLFGVPVVTSLLSLWATEVIP